MATRVIPEIESRRVLLLQRSFDIAKGRDGDHSELGTELALDLCGHGLSQEETRPSTGLSGITC